MFKNLNKATTTTIIALTFVIMSVLYFFFISIFKTVISEVIQTLILNGMLTIDMLIMTYFFGASKDREDKNKLSN